MYCYFCGKENKDEQNFCKYCGQKLHLSELIPESEPEQVNEPVHEAVSEQIPEIGPENIIEPEYSVSTEQKPESVCEQIPEIKSEENSEINPEPVEEQTLVVEAEDATENMAEPEYESEPECEPESEYESVPEIKPDPDWMTETEPEPDWTADVNPDPDLFEEEIETEPSQMKTEPEQPAKESGINKLLICVIVLLSLILVMLGSFLVTYFVKGTLNPLELFNSEKKEVSIDETGAGSDISAEVTEADKPDAEETDKEDTDKEGEGQETAGPDSKGDNDGKDEESSVGDDGEEDASGILEDSVWQDAYRKTLKDSVDGKVNRNETVYYYYVYDIDKDDVPELIVQYDDSVAGAHGLVYRIGKTDREPVQIGDIGLGGSGLYTYPGKNGIIRNYARMDYQVVDVLSIENDTIEENNIHEQENDFNGKKEWYTDIDDIVTGALYIEPTEPTDDSAISGYRDHVKEIVSMKNKDIHRYEIFTEDITWTEAYEKCRQMGGYLARIDTEEENDHICVLLNSKGVNGIAYIGGRRDPDSMEYYWVGNDGELYDYDISYGEFYKFWLDDEPSYKDEVDGKTVDECYMSMLYKKNEGKWYWNDISNDVRALAPKYYTGKISYICEYE